MVTADEPEPREDSQVSCVSYMIDGPVLTRRTRFGILGRSERVSPFNGVLAQLDRAPDC